MFNLFDFNHDGEVTAAEFALGLSIMEEIEAEECQNKKNSEDMESGEEE